MNTDPLTKTKCQCNQAWVVSDDPKIEDVESSSSPSLYTGNFCEVSVNLCQQINDCDDQTTTCQMVPHKGYKCICKTGLSQINADTCGKPEEESKMLQNVEGKTNQSDIFKFTGYFKLTEPEPIIENPSPTVDLTTLKTTTQNSKVTPNSACQRLKTSLALSFICFLIMKLP